MVKFTYVLYVQKNRKYKKSNRKNKVKPGLYVQYQRMSNNTRLCPSGISTTASVEVNAEASVLWAIVSDLQETADAQSAVQEFAYLDRSRSKGKFEVGTRVREIRQCNGGDRITMQRQIVAISDREYPRSVSFSSNFDESIPAGMVGIANTSTLTVVPLTDTTSELIGSYAVQSTGGCCWRCIFCWLTTSTRCSTGRSRPHERHFQKEMAEIGAAAERKQAAIIATNNESNNSVLRDSGHA